LGEKPDPDLIKRAYILDPEIRTLDFRKSAFMCAVFDFG
jgi:hypothetical protein